MKVAYQNLEYGISTILAAPFVNELTDECWMQRLKNRCDSYSTSVVVAWVTCDLDSMHEYLSRRGAARDAWKLANWHQWVSEVDLHNRPACNYSEIDNQLNAAVGLADQARDLLKRISNK
jgi:hypothetical protein